MDEMCFMIRTWPSSSDIFRTGITPKTVKKLRPSLVVAVELKSFHCTAIANPEWVLNLNIAAMLQAAGSWQSQCLRLELQYDYEAEE
jgi:hypothetical protein